MSIEDGQKKFAAKRKQRQCHNSCPLISIRVIYYLIQLVFIAFGLFAIVVSAMTFDKFKAGSIVEMDGVDIQEFFPIRLIIRAIGGLTIVMAIIAITSVARQARILACFYIIFLMVLIAAQLVALSKANSLNEDLEGKMNLRWDILPDEAKDKIQESLNCCGFYSVHDRPVSGRKGQCPEGATMGCAEMVFEKGRKLKDGSFVLCFALSGFEAVIAISTFLLVFLC